MIIPRPVAGLAAGAIDAEMRLVAASSEDFASLYALHRQAMAPALAALDGWDEPTRRADFSRLLARVPSFFIGADEVVLGYLQVLPRSDALHIVNVAFDAPFRDAGRGARLFAWLRGQAGRRHCRLHFKAYCSNPRALAFYQREGFVVTRRDTRHWWLDWMPAASADNRHGRRGASRPAFS